jgi:hypothetical protein
MESTGNNKPSRIMLRFFRWFCNPDRQEEIEGDLLERFHKCSEEYGIKKARVLFIKEVLLLFRPAVMGSIDHLTIKLYSEMKKLQWLQLIALNLLVILCIFLPFLPGPYDKMANGLSGMAQVIGFGGLLLVPISILWLIQEIKKIAGNNKTRNHWSSGYYYAITATCICTFICLFLVLALLVSTGPSAAIVALAVVAFAIYKLTPLIKNLKHTSNNIFNAAPLYLLSIPLIAFTVRMFFIGPVSDYSRYYAIEKAQIVISAIENYHDQKGNYPESIGELHHIPKPSVMGISEFHYERNGNAYNLSFVQWQHVLATKEVVMYNKNDEHNVKGHFASYDARQPHWRYYWLD